MRLQRRTVTDSAINALKAILTWNWTKRLLYWLILSAGTMSELVFLVASLWMSVNSSVHPFVRLYLSEEMTIHISQLATAAYVALPELILGLAFVTTISHVRIWLYNGSPLAGMWAILYGIPTLIFLVLSLLTLAFSVASTQFIMPEPLIIVRALAGFLFAFTSLLYMQLGVPQERDRLADKDVLLASLTSLLDEHKRVIDDYKNEIARLDKQIIDTREQASQATSNDLENWLSQGHKTISVDDIMRLTGYSKRKITGAITSKALLPSTRNKDLILTDSFVLWMDNNPVQTGTSPRLHIVNGQ